MRTTLKKGTATLLAAVVMAAAAQGAHAGTGGDLKAGERTDTIAVPEMQCGMCESRIEKTVKELKGVSTVAADAEANRVIVTYNPKSVSRESIEKAIAGAGYDAGRASTTAAAQAKLHACCRPGAHDE